MSELPHLEFLRPAQRNKPSLLSSPHHHEEDFTATLTHDVESCEIEHIYRCAEVVRKVAHIKQSTNPYVFNGENVTSSLHDVPEALYTLMH